MDGSSVTRLVRAFLSRVPPVSSERLKALPGSLDRRKSPGSRAVLVLRFRAIEKREAQRG